ncbi:helix-turn-helix domain-containing protein [Rosenbergiella australiborealis]|uniref:Helix-turn-helix transcriptional regulator n=1 Tax=Rosenbergiella australiborealis TaxID=1544696 RepID=A0ABS5T4G3_9GAMM|nr:AraC family transcriptional regulator [Rosenbergiella australiborealis]MBT0727211.1 helix-turn-helix transcriptional regulator [Rosenbergiella australiborealis]
MNYKTFDTLSQQRATLHQKVALNSGIQLASWSNHHDQITVNSDHHTLSLYVEGGYQSYQKCRGGWHNGGGPDKLCIMPKDVESHWDIRGPLSFVHLYCTQQHLRQTGEQIWDRSPADFSLVETSFQRDDKVTALYRHFLLSYDWQDSANQLVLSSASTLLLTHLIQHYSQVNWRLPTVTGGLSPYVLRNIRDYIDAHIADPLTLAILAKQAALSEYHFARMFTASMNVPPHHYVMQRRLHLAQQLMSTTHLSFTEIAYRCGFSSASHLSNRFKNETGLTPTQFRQHR